MINKIWNSDGFYAIQEGGMLLNKVQKVLKIALPAVFEMTFYTLISVVDTALVGKYGADNALSAVGFSTEIIATVMNMFISMGVGVGITTMVAQNIGAGKKERAEEFFNQGILIGIFVSIVICSILGFFPKQVLRVFGASGSILKDGSGFIRIVIIGAFFNMLNSMMNSALRGTGNTIIPFCVSFIINVVAIPLDIVLIFGKFGLKPLGIIGSAIATSTGYICGFIFLCFYFKFFSSFKLRIDYIKKVNKDYIRKIIRLAIPSGLQEGAFSVSRLVTVSMIMYIGTKAFAANQITTQIESISFMPGWGFAVAATSLVGQRIGAKDYDNAREYAKISTVLGICVMLVCSVLFFAIPETIVKLFINKSDTIDLAKGCLIIAAIEQPFMALSMVLGGVLKGAGDTKTPFKIALISSWLIRVPLMAFAIYVLKLSVVYVWVVTSIQWGFDGIAMLYMYKKKSKAWKEVETP